MGELDNVDRPVPPGLYERGAALWVAMTAGQPVDAAKETLLLEACRLADRLDALDACIQGRQGNIAEVYINDSGTVKLVVDSVVGEARMHALALRQLMITLLSQSDSKQSSSDPADEVRRRREERMRKAAGEC